MSLFDGIQGVLDDLRFSFRELRKKPGLALTAIISLTLGIGATTAVFSVIYGLLVNPYPYKAADRMIHLVLVNERGEKRWPGITGPQLRLLQQVRSIESAAATWGPIPSGPPSRCAIVITMPSTAATIPRPGSASPVVRSREAGACCSA